MSTRYSPSPTKPTEKTLQPFVHSHEQQGQHSPSSLLPLTMTTTTRTFSNFVSSSCNKSSSNAATATPATTTTATTTILRFITNLFLLIILSTFFIDAWPTEWMGSKNILLKRSRVHIDPFLKATGLWQGQWYLFSPRPPTENLYFRIIVVEYNPEMKRMEVIDGYTEWRSPDWKSMTSYEKRRMFRIQEYIDSMDVPGNKPIRLSLLYHLINENTLAPNKVVSPTTFNNNNNNHEKNGNTNTTTTTTTRNENAARRRRETFAQIKECWRDIHGPENLTAVTTTTMTDRHWLLGEKFRSTLSEEFEQILERVPFPR